ncbi:MAG: NAD(P)H-dependent oxidoreductase [Phycisphaerae bacterium]|jgi:multimeric flavodoxin WrbA|nr:NAD(P)H-dependent oxidoreductase [Phycisphaerae bacterium]
MADDLTRRVFLGSAGIALAATAASAAPESGEGKKPGGARIIAISCSPRKGKGTAAALKECLKGSKGVGDGIETELIELAGLDIDGSVAAGVPLAPGRKDDFSSVAKKLSDPKVAGIIIGTPVYFSSMSSLCKSFIERMMVFYRKDVLAGMPVGVLAVGGSRNGGQEVTIRSVQDSLFCYDMVVVGTGRRFGAAVWAKGGVENDKEGMKAANNLGRRVAETSLALKG